MSDESKQILIRIQYQLQTCWSRLIVERVSAGLVLVMIITVSWLALLLMVEIRLWMPTFWRSSLFWAWISGSFILLIWLVIWPSLNGWLTRKEYTKIASAVTQKNNGLQNQVICLLELCGGKSSPSPQPLLDSAIKSLNTEVSKLPLVNKINWQVPLSWSRFGVIPLGLIIILLVATPHGLGHASARLFSPGTTFVRPAPFTFSVIPGNTTLTKGDSVTVIAKTHGNESPEFVTLEVGISGENTVLSHTIYPDTLGQFVHQEHNVRLPLRYRAVSDPVQSQWYQISIVDRPILRDIQITLTPPSYTKLPALDLPAGTGHITALQGTRADIQVSSSIPNSRAWISLDSDTNLVHLDELSGKITIDDATTYRILLESPSGVPNLDPINYSITPIFDQYPFVEITSPNGNATMDFELLVPFTFRVQDDFGYSRFTLSWRLSESRFGDPMESFDDLELPLPNAPEVEYLWDLDATTELDIVPGDVVSYYVTLWDNDGHSGPKKRVSSIQQLRFPSITERYETLESTQQETESSLESLISDAEMIRSQFDELRDEVRRKQDSSWDDRQNLEALQEAQQTLQMRVEDLTSSMADAAQQMDKHNLVSDDLLDLFDEIQKVTQEISSPELMEALKQLEEALSGLDPAAMQESLEKFEFNEEMFRERMERALELFKSFQVQQQLEEAATRAEDIKTIQENLSEQTRKDTPTETTESLTLEQQEAAQDMRSLEAKMEEIARRMEEMQNAPTAEMNHLNRETLDQEIPQQMQQNAQQMKSGQMQQANQGQQNMIQSMQQLQSDLSQMQSQMSGQQMRINTAALKKILSNALRLSIDQEQLRSDITQTTQESSLLRGFARRQSVLSTGGTLVADSLQSLGRSLPQLTREVQQLAGNAILNMDASTQALTARNPLSAQAFAGQSMTNLNDLALLLTNILDQLMNSSSSGSGGMSMENMIQQLQQMAQRQDQLNQALKDIYGQQSGERLSLDMQQRLNQLAAQQEAMRRQLSEMAQERALANQLAGDLERIAQQMEETVRDLQSHQVNRPAIQRQQQILTRLLDASRSLQERGRERQREGRQGDDLDRTSPPPLAPSMTRDQLQRALIDALESGYARDYQMLIQRYFELLERE